MKTDWINLCDELGWEERRIPVRMRDPAMFGIGWCSSLAVLYATLDPRPNGATVDPRSGGLIGWKRLCEVLGGVSQRTARRILAKPYGGSVLMIDGVPATTANTGTEIRRRHDLEVSEVRRQARLGRRLPLDAAPGSTCLMMNEPILETAVAESPDVAAGCGA